VIAVAILAAFALPTNAQTQVPDSGRSNAAAWRPSFNPIEKGALPQTDASSRQSSNGNNAFSNSRIVDRSNNQQGFNPAPFNRRDDRTASRSSVDPQKTPGVTRVTRTFEKLPNSAGQVWREYDITPYTSELVDNDRPQQAVLDWILKETGTKLWFNEPFGILSADEKKVMVYHTPEIHRAVRAIIDRFNRTRAQSQVFEVNLVTVKNPNWRSQAYPILQPVEVRSPGIEAWLISKENAAILQGQLARRADFKRHSGGRVASPDGQTFVLEKSRPVSFIQALEWIPNQVPNYRPKTKTINEGYRLGLSCLTSLDNRTIEAIIDCDVDQVEKLTPVKVDLPARGGVLEQLDLNIPQLVSWRVNERVRWPSDQVLLLSCGIVASPEADGEVPRAGGLNNVFAKLRPEKRSDALLFIEFRGPQSGSTVPRTAGSSGALVPVNRK
jgi:hypothetical protein